MANIILWTTFYSENTLVRPLGAYKLASWLRLNGYTVKVIDFCHLMSPEDLISITEKYITDKTLTIGVSSTFWNSVDQNLKTFSNRSTIEPSWVVNARLILEEKYPKLLWSLGGAKSDRENTRFIWKKFSGFAEDTFLKWIDENSKRLRRAEAFDIKTSETIFSKDDFILPQETLPIELGRGCMFKCKFCSYPLIGKKPGTYLRDYSYIREEFIRNYNEWGTTNYYFQDDTVNEDPEKIRAIADIVQGLPFELKWVGYNRLDLIYSKQDTISMLKDSGLKSTQFGIESFNPEASKSVGKGWNGKHAKDFLLTLKDKWGPDINWTLSFIAGLPGEDKESLLETAKWCIDNKMYHWVFFPLGLDSSPSKHWKSEFEINSKLYGYTFKDNDPAFWMLGDWDLSKATEYAKYLNEISVDHTKISSWLLFGVSSLDIAPLDTLMQINRKDLPVIELEKRKKSIIANYIQSQLR